MRKVDELVNTADPAWKYVEQWIDSAKNRVKILPADIAKAKDALFKTQVTTRSPMGAIVYMTGGLIIDNGWIRILGSGDSALPRSLPDWNKGKTIKEFGQPARYLIIADDVIGGFFLLNGGELGDDLGKVYYFAPENLEYEALNMTYTDFLDFCFNGDLDEFYQGYRWTNWKNDVSNLKGDEVFNFYPCLWTKEGKEVDKTLRKAIPVDEQYVLNIDFRKQLGIGR